MTTYQPNLDDFKEVSITENAMTVLKARYLKKDKQGKFLETPKQLFIRVANVIAQAENNYGATEEDVKKSTTEFYDIMADGLFLPNSPTLMNAGRRMGMLSACFVLPVEDSIDEIFSSIKNTAIIQKAGGGTGFSFSRLRPEGDRISSSGGTTSGPLSFIKVFSEATNAIQQGAFRRGANMGVMRIDHPDIVKFIMIKEDLGQLTNYNLSVAVTDEFMENVIHSPTKEHIVVNPRSGEKSTLKKDKKENWKVGELFEFITEKAWQSGEPGVIFIDEMNRKNPTPHIGQIEATNPCGEQPLLPYESCNLGSINVAKFVKPGKHYDWKSLKSVIETAVRFLDNVIEVNRYPINEVKKMTAANRKIGLGIMGFADLLFKLGIKYDSDEGLDFGNKLMSFIQEESHKASQKLAKVRGVFPNYEGSAWSEKKIEIRNAATTTVAPTGSISIIADTSGGIEPMFNLVFVRNILEGKKLLEVNRVFEEVAKKRGFYSDTLMEKIAEVGSLQELDVPQDIKDVFVTARDIAPHWHVRMQGAFQEHCDSSISKTINFDNTAKVKDVQDIFLMSYKLHCKGITVYRDGCRENQPMALKEKEKKVEKPKFTTAIEDKLSYVKPMHLPDIMSAIRIKQKTPFGQMHIKIVVDPITEREREVFATLGKGGDVASSDLEAICRLISLYLRVNGSLEDVQNQLDGIGSSLTIPTKDGKITSLADALSKAIKKYLEAKKRFSVHDILLGKSDLSDLQRGLKSIGKAAKGDEYLSGGAFKVKCPECEGDLSFEEGCTKCHSCGFTLCS